MSEAVLDPRLSGVRKYQNPVYAGTYFITCEDVLRLLDNQKPETIVEQAPQPTCDDCGHCEERHCKHPAGVVKKTIELPDGFGCSLHEKAVSE